MPTLPEARKAFKTLGYRLKTKRYSDFIGAFIVAPDGTEINAGNVFTEEFLKTHEAAFAIRNQLKGNVLDGDWRVVL